MFLCGAVLATTAIPADAVSYCREGTPACYSVQASPTLNVRSGSSTASSVIGSLNYGDHVIIDCQYRSNSSVGGSTIWDFLGYDGAGNEQWVADFWMSTPAFNNFSPLPVCYQP
jgi:uncharacterized protein YraI